MFSVPDARIRATVHKEISRGTWGTAPFDNDTAADFADALDEAESEAREPLIRWALVRTIDAPGCLMEAEEAVTAAASIAAQCLEGDPVDTPYGPETPMPPVLLRPACSRGRIRPARSRRRSPRPHRRRGGRADLEPG
ncbi:DUF4259 domain-containing protein [Streptomyces virginiae]